MKTKIIFALVRSSADGYEFIDMKTVSESYEMSLQKAKTTIDTNKTWSRANPGQRIARFEIKEIKP